MSSNAFSGSPGHAFIRSRAHQRLAPGGIGPGWVKSYHDIAGYAPFDSCRRGSGSDDPYHDDIDPFVASVILPLISGGLEPPVHNVAIIDMDLCDDPRFLTEIWTCRVLAPEIAVDCILRRTTDLNKRSGNIFSKVYEESLDGGTTFDVVYTYHLSNAGVLTTSGSEPFPGFWPFEQIEGFGGTPRNRTADVGPNDASGTLHADYTQGAGGIAQISWTQTMLNRPGESWSVHEAGAEAVELLNWVDMSSLPAGWGAFIRYIGPVNSYPLTLWVDYAPLDLPNGWPQSPGFVDVGAYIESGPYRGVWAMKSIVLYGGGNYVKRTTLQTKAVQSNAVFPDPTNGVWELMEAPEDTVFSKAAGRKVLYGPNPQGITQIAYHSALISVDRVTIDTDRRPL